MIKSSLYALILLIVQGVTAFVPPNAKPMAAFRLNSEAGTSSSTIVAKIPGIKATEEWEIDCYSRPVMVEGKKLWEVLITDSSGSFRLIETLPSNK
jgi:hypothetical protein